jgi:hypothetical protein
MAGHEIWYRRTADQRQRRTPMSSLVVFDFDGIHTADEVLNKLRSLEKELSDRS